MSQEPLTPGPSPPRGEGRQGIGPSPSRSEGRPNRKPRREPPHEESYQLLIACRDEATQEELFEELTHRGFRCRVLTM